MSQKVKNLLIQLMQLQQDIDSLPGIQVHVPTLTSPRLTALEVVVSDEELYRKIRKLFENGHHAEAVEKAFKFLDNLVKRSTLSDRTGAKLMEQVFSADKPLLPLNALENESEQNEQAGYLRIFAGAMIGIRNPRAHESDWEDTEERALQLLSLANHLVQKVRLAIDIVENKKLDVETEDVYRA